MMFDGKCPQEGLWAQGGNCHFDNSKQKKGAAFLSQMLDDGFVSEMCFLGNIFHHLNALNLDCCNLCSKIQWSWHPQRVAVFREGPIYQCRYFPKGAGVPCVTWHWWMCPLPGEHWHASIIWSEAHALKRWLQKVLDYVENSPNVKRLAIYVLTMFGSTYTCESSFSHMNAIKNKCSLTNEHLHLCLHTAFTSYEPSFSAIVLSKKCNLSH